MIQVTERYPPAIGGVETHVSALSRELVRMGVKVTVLTSDLLRTNPMRRMAVPQNPSYEEGVLVHRFRAVEVLPLRQGLEVISPQAFLRLRGADVIHAHGFGRFPTYIAGLKRVFHTPVIVTTHSDIGRPSIRKSLFDAAVSTPTIRSADRLIALTNHERAVLERLGVRHDSIEVIPNGVNPDEFDRTRSRHQSGYRTILYVGRIDFDQKGVDVLLRAFSLLPKPIRSRSRLRLVGPDWGDLGKCHALAAELKIANSIEYSGILPREGIADAMSKADVLCLPSRFEPFGIVLLEAMAAGLPVVASRVGGVGELVREGENGVLAEPGDANSLSRQLERILADPAYGERLAGSARTLLSSYLWSTIARRTISLYEEAIARSTGR